MIDATPDAVLARQRPAEFQPFQPGPKDAQFIVVGGEPSEDVNSRDIPGIRFVSKGKQNREYPIYEYTLSIANQSDTFRARSQDLNRMRSVVYHSAMVDHSERLLYFPDNPIVPAKVGNEDDRSSDVFRPKGVANLYVLSAYAGGLAPKNGFNSPWSSDLDMRIQQDIGLWKEHQVQIYLDIDNVLNLIGADNYKRYADTGDIQEGVRVIQANADVTGVYEVEDIFFEGINQDVDDSIWRIQIGVRYKF